jgi:hypothetical protein
MHPIYSFRCPFRVCGLDYPFTQRGACTARVPAV